MERHSSYMRLNKTRALQLENKMSDGRAIGMNMMEKGEDRIMTCFNKRRYFLLIILLPNSCSWSLLEAKCWVKLIV